MGKGSVYNELKNKIHRLRSSNYYGRYNVRADTLVGFEAEPGKPGPS